MIDLPCAAERLPEPLYNDRRRISYPARLMILGLGAGRHPSGFAAIPFYLFVLFMTFL